MELAELTTVLLIGLPFWAAAVAIVLRQRSHRAERRARLLVRIGVAVEAKPRHERRERRPLVRALELRLQQAGLAGRSNRLKQWALGGASMIGILGLITATLFGPAVALLAAGVAAIGPAYVFYRIMARRKRFAEQFPDALEALVRSLHAGITVDAAMRMVAEDFPAPLAGEFERMNKQVQLGVPLSSALRDLQRRVGIPEAQYFAAAVIVQREAGGQLADVLAQLASVMRRRAMFQGKLRALTAESRFTAWFIGGAPLAFIVGKYLFDRRSMTFFLEDPSGQSMFRFAVIMILIGTVLLRQMLRIRF